MRRWCILLLVLLLLALPRAAARSAKDSPCPGLRLNEILSYPNSDWNRDRSANVYDQWVEILNSGASACDLYGWVLHNTWGSYGSAVHSWYTFTANLELPAGGYLVLYRNDDQGLRLSEHYISDLSLIAPDGTTADRNWQVRRMLADRSEARSDDGSVWNPSECPTPGKANHFAPPCPKDLGPLYLPLVQR
ncbi:MAG: lamin tail domain-containing protein [Anaerolineae bacterium]